MKLSTTAILALIGAVLTMIGLFVPAAYGIVSNGINSGGSISLFETGDGYIYLIATLMAFVFALINNLDRWAWIFGTIIVIVGLLNLNSFNSYMQGLYAQAPMYKEFIRFGPGLFVVLFGGAMIGISGLFTEKSQALMSGASKQNVMDENVSMTAVYAAEKEMAKGKVNEQ